jgi:beta-galactosidase/beta-glucuronidase
MIKHLKTKYSDCFGDIPLPEYPRPALRRDSFINLNGKWDFGVVSDMKAPIFDREITVPFPPESLLSGINELFDESLTLCYRKTFTFPEDFVKDRVILHFGAVDQYAYVYLNGAFVGDHTGGYRNFSFDVTDHVKDENTLVVLVRDELSSHVLPYGKQCRKRGGMWYTPISGIWQTVWLESVSKNHITSLELPTSPEDLTLRVNFSGGSKDGEVCVKTPESDLVFEIKTEKQSSILLPHVCGHPRIRICTGS